MLGEAVRDELVDRHVASVVRAPSVPQQEVRPWSTEEAARFLESVSEHRMCALVATRVALGLCKGELLAPCASLLLAQNVPARIVMEVLGHSQLPMTIDH